MPDCGRQRSRTITTRERLEAKQEQREDWAASRTAKANVVFREAEKYHGNHAFNFQPGHIPERARLIKREERAFGDMQMADHHASKAAGLAEQLDRSVFSDDTDAIEKLEGRIKENEATADTYAKINKAWRKSKGNLPALVASGLIGAKLAETIASTIRVCPYLRVPFDTTNIRARIRSDKERIEEVKRRQARTEAAENSGGVCVEGAEWVRVTFAEKPEREVLDALRGADFRWCGGSWVGRRASLPPSVLALVPGQPESVA